MKRRSRGERVTRLKSKLKTEAAARRVRAEREKMPKGECGHTHTVRAWTEGLKMLNASELGTDVPAEEKGVLERQGKILGSNKKPKKEEI